MGFKPLHLRLLGPRQQAGMVHNPHWELDLLWRGHEDRRKRTLQQKRVISDSLRRQK